MARAKFQTLSEQMFYVLLCLRVPAMTQGRVHVGSGTLYNLLEQFLEAECIVETRVEGRRRSYLITPKGQEMLDQEYARICAQARDYRQTMGEEERS